MERFSIVEASIEDHRRALVGGTTTSVELVVRYLIRIATYDFQGGLHAFTVMNDKVLEEAQASDRRRQSGSSLGPLDGIPYTLKDSYKYAGLTVSNGSPALEGLMSSEDSYVASKLREAGAIMIGKTNMPPMAAGGMQRGLYGRAESPYNAEFLTAAFSSGSSNGAATSTTASFAAFGMASETVSSGRSPASNNALVAYTPSRGIISCVGLWPLYVTCDDAVPYARSVTDMLALLNVITKPDPSSVGDFWRDQPHVQLPSSQNIDYTNLQDKASLKNKRIAVPKRYIGGTDSHPNAKSTTVSPEVISLWTQARADLEELGATVVETDFPLVSNYEDDSISNEANNVVGAPSYWNSTERGVLIAKVWDDFLIANKDGKLSDLTKTDASLLFPKPQDYIPDLFVEKKNLISYEGLPNLAQANKETSLFDLPGLEQALKALEAQRKRDLEQWMDEHGFDVVVFPSAADVGKADLEFSVESAEHALQNGIKYSNGNRAIRHLGVPTVSVPMGTMAQKQMPVNLTFAGKAYTDDKLLQYAYAYEQKSLKRRPPPLTPELSTDSISRNPSFLSGLQKEQNLKISASAERSAVDGNTVIEVSGILSGAVTPKRLQVYLNGKPLPPVESGNGPWEVSGTCDDPNRVRLSYLLKPMSTPIMVLVTVSHEDAILAADISWV
ncbi:hypothetical protein LTR84_005486 [Exophiala bonariae]|uniref:Amidase domain-containing protein n=1 Tax=Exophiala bonariae TaxID=1690606 RepID=A0AAV9N669_9EURO|nr:hypothetical protein LTR84_005486 [Exophiala bonariae]